MASIDLKRSTPGLQPKRPSFQPHRADSDKLRTYHTLYRLNRAFELILFNLDRLEELGFRRKFLGLFRHRAEELRAETNFELVETMLEREQEDWTRSGRHTLAWDKRQQHDPEDARREAKQPKRKAQPARKSRRA